MMKLPKAVKTALKLLEEAGYEAVVVGGAVRDHLLGLTPNDYDISTNARPEAIKAVFHKFYTLDIGIKHGTVTVFINRKQIEITTYRSESEYRDYRHPERVIFERNLEADLQRRDFTINAICFNREFIDLVGGTEDLEKKLIRAIGSPKERFNEDPLRILRALRFAATLDFQIEPLTRKAMFSEKELLKKVSFERINLELSKLLAGKAAPAILRDYLPIFKIFLPELPEKIDYNLQVFKNVFSLSERLATLMLGLDLKESEEVLRRLKYSKTQVKQVIYLLKNLDLRIVSKETEIGKLLKDNDLKDLKCLINFQIAIRKARAKEIKALEKALTLIEKIDPNKCYRLKDLAVSGRDLLEMGYEEGIGIRLLLDRLLDLVIEGVLNNEKEELLGFLDKNHPPERKPLAK